MSGAYLIRKNSDKIKQEPSANWLPLKVFHFLSKEVNQYELHVFGKTARTLTHTQHPATSMPACQVLRYAAVCHL